MKVERSVKLILWADDSITDDELIAMLSIETGNVYTSVKHGRVEIIDIETLEENNHPAN